MNRGKKSTPLLFLLLFVSINTEIISQRQKQIDGPYVFYKGDSIVVKSIVDYQGFIAGSKSVFKNKNEINLHCFVAETGDSFTFKLHTKSEKQKSEYPLPEKMFVISDIHANFKGLKQILIGAGVVDKNLNWAFGKGHFVFDGDVFDRGTNPTECIWLIYKLEEEAEMAGGKVHFILGNHEIWNMNDNTKYVNNDILKNIPLLKEEYKNLFAKNTELGQWFRTKNVIEKIGRFVFVHGGVSSQLTSLNMSFDRINKIAIDCIGKGKEEIVLNDEKIIASSKEGPYWYRGFFVSPIPASQTNEILRSLSAERIIVGHTIVNSIASYYHGGVIAIQ